MTTETIKVFDVKKLQQVCNPFNDVLWGLSKPISKIEIDQAVLDYNLVRPNERYPAYRKEHIGRIAWYYVYGSSSPIALDFSEPTYSGSPITKGTHQFMAAIYRGDKTIRGVATGQEVEINKYLAK